MEASAERRDRTYGNWRRPRSAGIGQLGTLGTIVLLIGLIAVILTTAIFGLIAGLIVLVALGGVLGTLLVRDRHGKTGLQHITLRGGWIRTRMRRANLYRSGPTGLTPWGTYQLPGLLAPSTLSEAHDSYDRPFALLRMPTGNHYTVVLACEPDGAALVDQEQVDVWVARWGQWLAALGDEPGVIAASVTIETAPDTGTRLRNHVTSRIDPQAPPVSQAILSEVVDSYPAGSATIKAWVALTFSGIGRGRAKDQRQMAHELGARLPQLTQGLYGTGAGAVRPGVLPAAVRDRPGRLRPGRGHAARGGAGRRPAARPHLVRRRAQRRAGRLGPLPPRGRALDHVGDDRRAARRVALLDPLPAARPAPRHRAQADHPAVPDPQPRRGRPASSRATCATPPSAPRPARGRPRAPSTSSAPRRPPPRRRPAAPVSSTSGCWSPPRS